jgi:hypothetical protein
MATGRTTDDSSEHTAVTCTIRSVLDPSRGGGAEMKRDGPSGLSACIDDLHRFTNVDLHISPNLGAISVEHLLTYTGPTMQYHTHRLTTHATGP